MRNIELSTHAARFFPPTVQLEVGVLSLHAQRLCFRSVADVEVGLGLQVGERVVNCALLHNGHLERR
jgi:hypothetical protein